MAGQAIASTTSPAAQATASSTAAVASLGAAQPVPGLAALNAGGSARVVKVDCVTPGNCAATGTYHDAGESTQAWAAFEVSGTWQPATTIPGLNALNQGGNADVASVSCAEAGDCTTGGSYSDSKHNSIPWVADSVIGTWGNANPRLTASLIDIDNRTTQTIAGVNSASCATPGNCVAVLSIPVLLTGQNGQPTSIFPRAYLAAEINGIWGTPMPAAVIPDAGTNVPTLIPSVLRSVSCGRTTPNAPVIFCAASGTFSDSAGHEHAMAGFGAGFGTAPSLSQWGGFGDAVTFPGAHLTAPNATGPADSTVMACRPSGFCSWGGFYTDTQGHEQPFIGSEDGGTAENTQTVPGILELNTAGAASVHDLSCATSTDCAIAGSYEDSTPRGQAYVDADTGSGWGAAQPIEGVVNLPQATAVAVSCPPPASGGCVAGGSYRDTAAHTQAFITNQNDIAGTKDFGSFFGAQQVAGNLNAGGNASVTSVSCGAGTDCAIGGFYTDAAGHQQGFIVEQSTLTSTSVSESADTVAVGNEHALNITVKVRPSAAGGTPTGTVAVIANSTTVCVITLAGGSGTCAVPAGSLPAGNYTLGAFYRGDQAYDGSDTGTVGGDITFRVIPTPLATSTALALSAAKVTFGHEQAGHLTVTVTGPSGDTPTGQVTVKAGSTTLGKVTLGGGKGTRTLTASQLRPGTYHLTAAYGGDPANNGSTSASKALTVTSQPTSTVLTLSAAEAKAGHEQSERLSVQVTPSVSGTPAGKVTIKAGSTTLCAITLKGAKGSCTLTASELRPGTYQLTASYPGATPYAGSTSLKKALTVTK
jgi:hypothetical protein